MNPVRHAGRGFSLVNPTLDTDRRFRHVARDGGSASRVAGAATPHAGYNVEFPEKKRLRNR